MIDQHYSSTSSSAEIGTDHHRGLPDEGLAAPVAGPFQQRLCSRYAYQPHQQHQHHHQQSQHQNQRAVATETQLYQTGYHQQQHHHEYYPHHQTWQQDEHLCSQQQQQYGNVTSSYNWYGGTWTSPQGHQRAPNHSSLSYDASGKYVTSRYQPHQQQIVHSQQAVQQQPDVSLPPPYGQPERSSLVQSSSNRPTYQQQPQQPQQQPQHPTKSFTEPKKATVSSSPSPYNQTQLNPTTYPLTPSASPASVYSSSSSTSSSSSQQCIPPEHFPPTPYSAMECLHSPNSEIEYHSQSSIVPQTPQTQAPQSVQSSHSLADELGGGSSSSFEKDDEDVSRDDDDDDLCSVSIHELIGSALATAESELEEGLAGRDDARSDHNNTPDRQKISDKPNSPSTAETNSDVKRPQSLEDIERVLKEDWLRRKRRKERHLSRKRSVAATTATSRADFNPVALNEALGDASDELEAALGGKSVADLFFFSQTQQSTGETKTSRQLEFHEGRKTVFQAQAMMAGKKGAEKDIHFELTSSENNSAESDIDDEHCSSNNAIPMEEQRDEINSPLPINLGFNLRSLEAQLGAEIEAALNQKLSGKTSSSGATDGSFLRVQIDIRTTLVGNNNDDPPASPANLSEEMKRQRKSGRKRSHHWAPSSSSSSASLKRSKSVLMTPSRCLSSSEDDGLDGPEDKAKRRRRCLRREEVMPGNIHRQTQKWEGHKMAPIKHKQDPPPSTCLEPVNRRPPRRLGRRSPSPSQHVDNVINPAADEETFKTKTKNAPKQLRHHHFYQCPKCGMQVALDGPDSVALIAAHICGQVSGLSLGRFCSALRSFQPQAKLVVAAESGSVTLATTVICASKECQGITFQIDDVRGMWKHLVAKHEPRTDYCPFCDRRFPDLEGHMSDLQNERLHRDRLSALLPSSACTTQASSTCSTVKYRCSHCGSSHAPHPVLPDWLSKRMCCECLTKTTPETPGDKVVVFCALCKQGKYGYRCSLQQDVCADCLEIVDAFRDQVWQRRGQEECAGQVRKMFNELMTHLKTQPKKQIAVVPPEPRNHAHESQQHQENRLLPMKKPQECGNISNTPTIQVDEAKPCDDSTQPRLAAEQRLKALFYAADSSSRSSVAAPSAVV